MNMVRDLGILFNEIFSMDVDKPFQRKVDEEFCYVELERHQILNAAKNCQTNLFVLFADYLSLIGADEHGATSGADSEEKAEALMKMSIAESPFENPEFSDLLGKLKEKAITQSYGMERLQKKVMEMDVQVYMNSIKVITELGWKLEILGHNLVLLKKILAEVCCNYYKSIQDHGGEMGLITRTEGSSRRQTVILDDSPMAKHSEMDLTEYNQTGDAILKGAQFLHFIATRIALSKGDAIQAFRSFRKAMRTRKKFGLSSTLRQHLIKTDKEMAAHSLEQMGGEHDTLELRRYEVELRSQEQMRNLELKNVIFFFNRGGFVLVE